MTAKTVATKRRRWLRRGFLLLVFLVCLWSGVVCLIAYSFVHPSRRALGRTPRAVKLNQYETVRFASSGIESVPLSGWFIPAAVKPKGIILLCHGYHGNRGSLLKYAAFLHRADFSVFLFDFRTSGDSGGEMCTIGNREVDDAMGAIAYLKTRPDTRNLPMGILGTSMGAAVALQATAKSPEIQAVVADSPYASLDRAIAQRFRWLMGDTAGPSLGVPVRFVGEKFIGCDASSVSPLNVVDKISPRPLMLFHGTADHVIRSDDSRLLFARAGEPKALYLVEGAQHIGSYDVLKGEYEKRVVTFFNKSLRSPAGVRNP